jgi:hypothetical protein
METLIRPGIASAEGSENPHRLICYVTGATGQAHIALDIASTVCATSITSDSTDKFLGSQLHPTIGGMYTCRCRQASG